MFNPAENRLPEFTRQKWRVWIETIWFFAKNASTKQFTRQKWRVWIETCIRHARAVCCHQFTRQKWRVWIETAKSPLSAQRLRNSPARNGGCGLKRRQRLPANLTDHNSPARNGGCGLKQHQPAHQPTQRGRIHPPEMAGVD